MLFCNPVASSLLLDDEFARIPGGILSARIVIMHLPAMASLTARLCVAVLQRAEGTESAGGPEDVPKVMHLPDIASAYI